VGDLKQIIIIRCLHFPKLFESEIHSYLPTYFTKAVVLLHSVGIGEEGNYLFSVAREVIAHKMKWKQHTCCYLEIGLRHLLRAH
jgi:hypothetical protein